MLSRFQKGLGLLILVALIWVISSFIVQDILTDHGFGRAFFLTFFANSLFAVNIPLLFALRRFRQRRFGQRRQQQGKGKHSYSSVTRERSLSASLASVPDAGDTVRADGGDDGDNSAQAVAMREAAPTAPIVPTPASPTTSVLSNSRCACISDFWDRPTFVAATRVTPLWFIANFLYNYSLSMTTVTSNTVLSATSGLFTFAIAVYMGQDFFTVWKIVGVLASLVGATLTAVADTTPPSLPPQSPSPSMASSPSADITPSMFMSTTPSRHGENGDYIFAGDLICLTAAVFYALYTTSIAHFLPSSESDTVMLFFGYIGCLGLVILSPVVVIFDLAGVEHIAMISSGALALIAIKGLFDNVLSDALWTVALKWTSPTVATVGLSLTIPFSIVAELFVRQKSPPMLGWIGAIFMVAGFIACSVRTSEQRQEERQQISA
jgi:solute carrier family 35 protein F5